MNKLFWASYNIILYYILAQIGAHLNLDEREGFITEPHSNLASSKSKHSPIVQGHPLYLYCACLLTRHYHSIILPTGIFSSRQSAKQWFIAWIHIAFMEVICLKQQ